MKNSYKSSTITNNKHDKDFRRDNADDDVDLHVDRPTVSSCEAKAYVEDIGKLGWLADKSRPDIALEVNKLQRRAAAPRPKDIEAMKQLNRYIKGTILGILLGKDPTTGLIGYIDASYNDCEDRKSTEAFVTYYAGCPISWLSRKENLVAKSSTSAEYIVFDEVVQETMWLLKMLK
ncbi:hypothetical protein N7465_000223 [Penicillium sp. CMV-2018d]|nr:hypothetical protein N7465_000223 [Penicillium sp. CMV-2018d]